MAGVARPARALPGVLFGITVAAELGALVLSWRLEPVYDTVLYMVFSVAMGGTGALIALKHPGNAMGWLFCCSASFNAVAADLAQGFGVRAAEQGWPGGPTAEWVALSSWLLTGVHLMFLLFPDGRLPGRRWRSVIWVMSLGLLGALPGWALSPRRGSEFVGGVNPYAVHWLPTDALFVVGFTLFGGSLVAAGLSLVVRFRRSQGVERQQLKWFASAAVVAAVVLPISGVLWDAVPAVRVLPAIALTAIPLAAGAAILRYRLYDIDVVINRTLVYATLSLVLGASYAAVTILLGASLGRGSDLTLVGATLVVAVVFRPVRVRIQDVVDRRFDRARYDAKHRMEAFLERLRAGDVDPEGVLDILREVLQDPALDLVFWLPEGGPLVDFTGTPIDIAGDPRERTPVVRDGQRLAEILHTTLDPPGQALAGATLAGGMLAIEMARLRVELRRQLAAVEQSRARILEAGDRERRRMERDLHDGAQQRLVSIGLVLRNVQHQLQQAPPELVSSTLDAAVTEISGTIEDLRELTHGLPPSQLDSGLALAFRELARRAPLPVDVTVPDERFNPGVEAAAYFISCEGLTNAVKHAHATRVGLTARRLNGSLVISVADDGNGGAIPGAGSGLSGLADRVAALGGRLTIQSDPGAGTTLTAELPCGS